MPHTVAAPRPDAPPKASVQVSRGFVEWMAEQDFALAFTSYHAGSLFMLGLAQGALRLHEQAFAGALGLALHGDSLWLASQTMIWRMQDIAGPPDGGATRVFQAKTSYLTGDLDAHELGVQADGQVVFVNTRYSCLATISHTDSFRPVWKPPFISRLAAEDRCHLNGLAMADGRPAYVTACSRSDVALGWRARRQNGGLVMDVAAERIVADGFSMPHSPRIGPDGRIWLLESGRGHLVAVDPLSGAREDVIFVPGFLRGLAFHGRFAILAVSKPRAMGFEGLELGAVIKANDFAPFCGLVVVDTATGAVVHSLRFGATVEELFNVIVMPGAACPVSLGPASPNLGEPITIEDA